MNDIKTTFRKLLKALRRDDGGPIVETALTMPVLVTMLAGAVQFAQIAYTSIECMNAARAAASYGAQSLTTEVDSDGIKNTAADDAANIASVLTTTVATTGICANGTACTGAGNTCSNTDCSGSQIETILTVHTSATVKPIVSLPGLPKTFTVYGKAAQKVVKN